VPVSSREHALVPEPFLIVGLVAVIRRQVAFRRAMAVAERS
jgi:hypothetical protein